MEPYMELYLDMDSVVLGELILGWGYISPCSVEGHFGGHSV